MRPQQRSWTYTGVLTKTVVVVIVIYMVVAYTYVENVAGRQSEAQVGFLPVEPEVNRQAVDAPKQHIYTEASNWGNKKPSNALHTEAADTRTPFAEVSTQPVPVKHVSPKYIPNKDYGNNLKSDAYVPLRAPIYNYPTALQPTDDMPAVKILYYSTFFGRRQPDEWLKGCPVPCFWTGDHNKMSQVELVAFHAPTMGGLPEKQDKKFVMHSMESEGYYSVLKPTSSAMKSMDYTMTYKLRSPPGLEHQILANPAPYFSNSEYSSFEQVRPEIWKKDGFAIWMHNNCAARSGRERVVKELMKYMEIDSYGSCLNNKASSDRANQKKPVDLVARYKFYMMFENVFGDPDWVSSTYFRIIDAGSVPVYFGAPNIQKFAPAPHSVINACEFESPQALADYLHYLDQNDTAYYEYLEWKKHGPSESFRSLMAISDVHSYCRMCIVQAATKIEQYNPAKQKEIQDYMDFHMNWLKFNELRDEETNLWCNSEVPRGWGI